MKLNNFSELKIKVKDVGIMAFTYECMLKGIDLDLYNFQLMFQEDIIKNDKLKNYLKCKNEDITSNDMLFLITRCSDGLQSGTRFCTDLNAKNTLSHKIVIVKKIALHLLHTLEEFIKENPAVVTTH